MSVSKRQLNSLLESEPLLLPDYDLIYVREARGEHGLEVGGATRWLPSVSAIQAVLLAGFYLLVGTLLPFYNKITLDGWPLLPSFVPFGDYPLTAAAVQLTVMCLLLTVYELLGRGCWLPAGASWAFGRRQRWRKLRLLLTPGLLFALVISLSNSGIVRPPLTVHLLLRSTEIWWTMVAALALRRELPTMATGLCCLAVAAGAVLVSADYARSLSQGGKSAGGSSSSVLVSWDVAANLASALCSGLLMAVLRDACVRLRQADRTSRVLEATLLKTLIAAVAVLVASVCLERDGWARLLRLTTAPPPADQYWPWWLGLLVGGAFLTLAYQALVVALTTFSYAVTVALLAQCKIVPQIPLAHWAFQKPFSTHPLHIVGLILVLTGAVCYAILRHRKKSGALPRESIDDDDEIIKILRT